MTVSPPAQLRQQILIGKLYVQFLLYPDACASVQFSGALLFIGCPLVNYRCRYQTKIVKWLNIGMFKVNREHLLREFSKISI